MCENLLSKDLVMLFLLTQVMFAGMAVGSAVIGNVSDIYGRKAVSLIFGLLIISMFSSPCFDV